ncbi:hypothetical protein [Ornithinibacillus scapharcae]|nr:hypothetical protein [Ornithinibacillus scapharcae]
MRKFLVGFFLIIIIGFGIIGIKQQFDTPEEVIKPKGVPTINIQS